MNIHMYIHIYVCVRVWGYVCVYIHTYIHVNIPSIPPHRTVCAFIIELSQLMLYREATGFRCVNFTGHINTHFGLTTGLLV